MKAITIAVCMFFILISSVSGQSHQDKLKRPSPPAEVVALIDSTEIRINYSMPAVKGRQVWGGLVPYGKVWRTGANEATVFETNKDLTIKDQKLPAGKYSLFTIPGESEWIVIFNSKWDQWGAFKYDTAHDVIRVTVPSLRSTQYNERVKFDVIENNVNLYWENVKVAIPLNN